MKRTTPICCVIVAGLLAAGSTAVQAQAFPTKPVRVVNPVPPASSAVTLTSQ